MRILPSLLILACLALTAACDSGPSAPAPQAEDSSGLAAQQTQIKDLFQQISALPESDLESFERLYKQAIECCPDTQRVHEAYFRLYNVYIYGAEPPRNLDALALCEDYIARYPGPDAPLHEEMQQHLLRHYEEQEQYDKLVVLYDQLFADGFEAVPLLQPEAHAYIYGKALEAVGRTEEAVTWYKVALEQYEPGHFMRDLAQEALDRLGG